MILVWPPRRKLTARSKDMLTDVTAMWEKVKPGSTFRLGLFVSLLPPQLWYPGFHQQKVGREARRSLNSHLGKVAKDIQAVVIPHHVITAQEKWFSDPRRNPTKLSEPGYDILIQDICLALTTRYAVQQHRATAPCGDRFLPWTSSKHCRNFTKEGQTRKEENQKG